jgi:tetratricopeptide (TPR) repeat protein
VTTEAGKTLLFAGHYAEAATQLERAIALDRSRNRPFVLIARALAMQGKYAEAIVAFEEGPRAGKPPRLPANAPMICIYRHAGRYADADAMVQQLTSASEPTSRARAHAFACDGDIEHAVEQFSKSIDENEPGLADALRSPDLAAFRSDPRAATLMQRLHLER